MALVRHSFDLEVTPGNPPPVLHVSEQDTNRSISIYLMQEGNPYIVPANTTAKIEGTMGERGFATDASISNNVIIFSLTENMTAERGRAWVKVKLTKGGSPISTCGFILDVDRAGADANAIINSGGFDTDILGAITLYLNDHEEEMTQIVSNWLAEHPEITTSLQDGEVTYEKMADGAEIEENNFKIATLRRKIAVMTGILRNVSIGNKRYRDGQVRMQLVRDLNLSGINYHVKVDRYNKDTLNTPYTEGRTTYVSGVCITYKNGNVYGTQLALPNGTSQTFRRMLNNGTWGHWYKLTSEATGIASDLDTLHSVNGGNDEDSENDFDLDRTTIITRWDARAGSDGESITKHTPWHIESSGGTTRATTHSSGICISYWNGGIGNQIAFPHGSYEICRRYKVQNSTNWKPWVLVAGGGS